MGARRPNVAPRQATLLQTSIRGRGQRRDRVTQRRPHSERIQAVFGRHRGTLRGLLAALLVLVLGPPRGRRGVPVLRAEWDGRRERDLPKRLRPDRLGEEGERCDGPGLYNIQCSEIFTLRNDKLHTET